VGKKRQRTSDKSIKNEAENRRNLLFRSAGRPETIPTSPIPDKKGAGPGGGGGGGSWGGGGRGGGWGGGGGGGGGGGVWGGTQTGVLEEGLGRKGGG